MADIVDLGELACYELPHQNLCCFTIQLFLSVKHLFACCKPFSKVLLLKQLYYNLKRLVSCKKISYGKCEQERLISTCSPAQSDQVSSLAYIVCFPEEYKILK